MKYKRKYVHLLKTYISSVKDADLNEEEILDSLTLLSWYTHRFWKNLVRHIFTATKLIAETYTQLIPKLPETLHYIYDPNWFPHNFITITEVPSETIQKLSINHNIEFKRRKSTIYMYRHSKNTHISLEDR